MLIEHVKMNLWVVIKKKKVWSTEENVGKLHALGESGESNRLKISRGLDAKSEKCIATTIKRTMLLPPWIGKCIKYLISCVTHHTTKIDTPKYLPQFFWPKKGKNNIPTHEHD